MNYITTVIEDSSIGGFGHVFYDILTSYIISKMFNNVEYVHTDIVSLGDIHHKGIKTGYKDDSYNWETFLQFGKNELRMNDIENLNLHKYEIHICTPFKSMDLEALTKIIASRENTLFLLKNNNRIYLNEIYYLKRNIYDNIFFSLKEKARHLKKITNSTTKKEIDIVMHIRRGDWDWQPLDYNINMINIIKTIYDKKDYKITVLSLGNEKQMNEIKNKLSLLDSNIVFNFNTDVFETFSLIYNADIVIGGHSNFPKIITMFSDNIFIYLPYKDGVIPALGVNNEFKNCYLGTQPELFDVEHRFETDIYCKKNINQIIEKLKMCKTL